MNAFVKAGNHAAVAAFIALRQNGYDLPFDVQKKLANDFGEMISRVAIKQDPRVISLPFDKAIDRRKSDAVGLSVT